MTNNNPIIHNGVVLHGITLAQPSQITYLVTNQAIIPKIIDKKSDELHNSSEKNILKNE